MSGPAVEAARAGDLAAARWIELGSHADERGILTAIESERDIPFQVRRVYLLHHLTGDRGGHAHRDTHQLMVAASGSCDLVLGDGRSTRTFRVDAPTRGLYFGPMLWIGVTNASPGASIMVLASTHYDRSRSIRTWEEYLEAIRR